MQLPQFVRAHHEHSFITKTVSLIMLRGYSMFELLITVAVISIVSGIAAPGMINVINKSQVTNTSNQILTSLHSARSYAITQQKSVHLCQQSTLHDTPFCSSERSYNSDWSNGWLIFSDFNQNHDFDQEDTLLSTFKPHSSVNVIFNQRGRLRYFSDGSSRSAGFYVCDQQKQHYRHVFLLHSGRVRISQQLSTRQQRICDLSEQ